ncbi:MAG TPA: nuclear transport factor 2 family protein [Cellvibrionaceae bacterium]
MNNSLEPITEFLQAYKAAVYRKDVDAFVALYDEQIHVFDMWGAWESKGIAQWRALTLQWFSSLGEDKVVVGVDEAQGYAAGDFASGHAFLTFTAVSKEGQQLRSLNNRITIVLKNNGSSWKAIHQHTSAPIDFSTMQVELHKA